MIRTIEFDDIAAVEASLKNLRRYNQAMYISVDETFINKELAEPYFRAEESSADEISLEKMIGAAAIKACNDNPDIPQEYKQKVGNRMQRELLSSFRAAKVDFMYYSGQLGMPTSIKAEKEREKRHKEIAIVAKTNYINKATKIIRRRSVRIAEKEGVRKVLEVLTDSEPTIKWTTRVIMWATSLIPDEVKDKVKETSIIAIERTAAIVNKNIERFANTHFGSKVVKVMNEKVAPVIQRGVEKVAEICSQVKQKAKSMWTKIKSYFA